jgi:peroxiredoxin Q/BCP
MSQLRQQFETITANGWSILGITAQRAEAVGEFARQQQIPFPILIDDDRAVTRAYGVYSAFTLEGMGVPTVNLPHNSTFLISSSGQISLAHVGLRSTDVPDEAMLLAAMARVE